MPINIGKFILVFIFIFSLGITVTAKEDKDGDSQKRKGGNNSQRNIDDKNGIQNNINVKEEIIQEKRNKGDNSKIRYEDKDGINIKREKIIKGIDDTENIKNKLNFFQRNINQSNDDFSSIQNQYLEIIKEIKSLNNGITSIISSLDKTQEDEVNAQIKVIEESKKKIDALIIKIGKELDAQKKDKKSISIKSQELEKEINKVNKQYRAIEWLLYEQ